MCISDRLSRAAQPDILANVVLELPGGMPAILAELQLHLRGILLLKQSALHRYYEVVRARSIDVLLVESKSAQRQSVTLHEKLYNDELRFMDVDVTAVTAELHPLASTHEHGEGKSACGPLLCGTTAALGACTSVEV